MDREGRAMHSISLAKKGFNVNIGENTNNITGLLPPGDACERILATPPQPTALDLISISLSALQVPPGIRRGGYLELKKWQEDIQCDVTNAPRYSFSERNFGCGSFTLLAVAMSKDYKESFKITLKAGAKVDDDDLLRHAAARNSLSGFARILLDHPHGADIDKRDGDSATPLVLALVYQHLNVVDLLLSRGGMKCVIEEFAFFKRMQDDGESEPLHIHVGLVPEEEH
ncbi:hypothetical protein M406DRAFT_75869 [Cryphonectria parasitica EP155]|uniref:Ankyrin repeat protein n=1 Tax=Cryphonectria parasitica (strain ATCC 38755 / EP155) TaxID=660469 RepID=A0A9P5CJS7_CRYP1|nr:uncharacterized protein M406DRAFT_75869 [Cryphonectria parasitica EP155]KAF3761313.1 hypothetical protein M406DRAFT_75869 [Cryphonectria parasitica EP155]